MTTPTASRRGRKPLKSKSCARTGCSQTLLYRLAGKRWCSATCRELDTEQAKADRLVEVIGHTPMTSGLRAELAEAGFAWERSRQLSNAIQNAALETGFTADQWEAITSGVADPSRNPDEAGGSQ